MLGGRCGGAIRFLSSHGKGISKDIKEMQMSGVGSKERSPNGRWAQVDFPSITDELGDSGQAMLTF